MIIIGSSSSALPPSWLGWGNEAGNGFGVQPQPLTSQRPLLRVWQGRSWAGVSWRSLAGELVGSCLGGNLTPITHFDTHDKLWSPPAPAVFLRVKDSLRVSSCGLRIASVTMLCDFMSLQGRWVQRSPCPPRSLPRSAVHALSGFAFPTASISCLSSPFWSFSPRLGKRIHDAHKHLNSPSHASPKAEGRGLSLDPSLLLSHSSHLLRLW